MAGARRWATRIWWRIEPLVCDWTAESGYQRGPGCWRTRASPRPIAPTTASRRGCCCGSTRAGRKVPDDFSVVGFDDVPEAAYFVPPLTTMRQDFGTLGRRCIEAVLVRIKGEPPQQTEPLLPVLKVRASSGPPRAA